MPAVADGSPRGVDWREPSLGLGAGEAAADLPRLWVAVPFGELRCCVEAASGLGRGRLRAEAVAERRARRLLCLF